MEPGMMQNTKKLLTNFETIRKDLKSADGQAKRHVQAWVSNVSQLNTDVQSQYGALKNVSVSDNATGGQGDSSMKQDPFLNLFEKLRSEINELIDKNASVILGLPKIRGQNSYKLSEEDIKMLWRKENSQLKQEMNEMLNTGYQMPVEDKFQCIAKLLQVRDNVQQQLFQGISYQKLVTWDDLSIKMEAAKDGGSQDVIYADSKAVELHNKISHFMETQKFLPKQLAWQPFDFAESTNNGPSLYSPDARLGQFDLVETVTYDKKEQFRKNNQKQETLRQELEKLHLEFKDYKEQYRKLQEQLSKTDAQMNQADETNARLQVMEHQVINLQEELEVARNQNKETQSKFMELKRKHKQLDDLHTKMKNSVIPKVNSTREYQKDLVDQIKKIREDSAMLPDMYRQQVKDSQDLEKTMKEAISARDIALQSDKRLRTAVKNLTEELDRKKRLAVTAMAARAGLQDQLANCQNQILTLNNTISEMQELNEEARVERDRFASKHDEMFNSVGNLNARIEELEQHKLHLLEKLKEKGDKGGLDYIIKTQKLENVRGKDEGSSSRKLAGAPAAGGMKQSSRMGESGGLSPKGDENQAINQQPSVSGGAIGESTEGK